nr:vegetative cell wall protein gp1-like [Aegilops tauschii subsp. strangulata]
MPPPPSPPSSFSPSSQPPARSIPARSSPSPPSDEDPRDLLVPARAFRQLPSLWIGLPISRAPPCRVAPAGRRCPETRRPLLCRSRQCLVCLPCITPRRRELVPKSRQRCLAKSSPSPPPVPKLRRRLPQSLSPSSSTVPDKDDALLSVSSAKSLASLPRRRSKSSSSPSPGNRSTSACPSPPPPDLVHSVAQPPVSFAASSSTSSDRGGRCLCLDTSR